MINVLDFGYVRLVEAMGSDLSIVRNARVSYGAEWRTGGEDEKLINYLWKNKHTSPFEAVSFTFEVKAPIFVLRQWHRHRTWSYNEVSARYTELPEEFYTPKQEHITTQSTSNKQMRTKEVHDNAVMWQLEMFTHNRKAFKLYKEMLNDGVPRELARSILPLSTYSHMFATVNLSNLFKFLTLRNHSHAQYEIRVYAEALQELIRPIVPVALKAYEQNP